MTALPNTTKIPILSTENVLLVAKTHIAQLRAGTASDDAERFVMTALERYASMCGSWEHSYTDLWKGFQHCLKYTPHFKSHPLSPLNDAAVAEWAEQNGVFYEKISTEYYVFRTHEESLLFKLKWT